MVVLDALAFPTAKTKLPASQVGVDVRRRHLQARGTALEDGRQVATM